MKEYLISCNTKLKLQLDNAYEGTLLYAIVNFKIHLNNLLIEILP
jgi:hypothetical protein